MWTEESILYRVVILYDRIHTETYHILSQTECGAWICIFGGKKFVNLKARKQWASVTEQKALDCFIARKNRHLNILRGQIKTIETGLRLIKTGNYKQQTISDFGGFEIF